MARLQSQQRREHSEEDTDEEATEADQKERSQAFEALGGLDLVLTQHGPKYSVYNNNHCI